MKKPSTETISLALILSVAALLRFWRIWDMEYFYDELSAILRANVNSWSAHIEKGVKPDGHPAFVQTLIWLIGDHVTLLKCLAASCGTAAVYFTYRAGKSAFNPAAGLAAAALMAVLYIPVFWSQQVRPYAFGMCFSTALLWTFSQILFEKKERNVLYLRFAILAALCAYTHYFSALFAALLFSMLLFSNKNRSKKILLSAVLSLLLFLPHASITLHQLREGGLGWLGTPNVTFLFDHLYEICNRSIYITGIIGIFMLSGIVVLWRNHAPISWNPIMVFFSLFLAPLIVGYVYSIAVSPVLQDSVLVFSLPALLLIIGYFCSQTPRVVFHLQLLVIATCSIVVLIQERKHYTVGYQEPWSSAVKYMQGHPQLAYAVNAPKDIFSYYMKKYQVSDQVKYHFIFSENEGVTLKKVRWYADSFRGKFILSSGTDPAFIGIYEELSCNYKHAASKTSWIGAEIPEFSYSGCNPGNPKTTNIPFRNFPYAWTGASIELFLDSLSPASNDAIIICYTPDSALLPKGEIQTALFNGDRIIDWRSSPLVSSPQGLPGLFYHSIKLADIPMWNKRTKLVVRLESAYRSGRFRIRISKGNPYLYRVN